MFCVLLKLLDCLDMFLIKYKLFVLIHLNQTGPNLNYQIGCWCEIVDSGTLMDYFL